MKNRNSACFTLLTFTLLGMSVAGAQGTATPAVDSSNPASACPENLLTDAVAWRQTAAEYQALYYQAYNLATLRLDAALNAQKTGDKPLAVITDVDDTVLNPAPYWGYLVTQCKDFFEDALWDKWVPDNQFLATPGSLAFFNYARSKGVEVFYVSSRDQGDRTLEYMIGNLKALNFPNADEQHVTALRDSSNKEPRQNEIAQTYNVVLKLGDSLNDFKRVYYVKDVDQRIKLMEADKDEFGKTFILLPNATDGHWLRAIFGDSEPPATPENRQMFRKAATKTVWQPSK